MLIVQLFDILFMFDAWRIFQGLLVKQEPGGLVIARILAGSNVQKQGYFLCKIISGCSLVAAL